MNSQVLVSVGIPVFNGAKTIKNVLNSILNQTYENIEVIISDNASTDNTEEVCSKIALKDKRISFYKQTDNIDIYQNYKFVLHKSAGNYFMWAADDDIRSRNFIEDCLNEIIKYKNCVASTSTEYFDLNERNDHISGSKPYRINTFLKKPFTAYGFFYSITYTKIAKAFVFPDRDVLGWDWIYDIHLLSHGDIRRARNSSITFDNTGLSNSIERFSKFRYSLINWIIPFSWLNSYLISLITPFSTEIKNEIYLRLAVLNYNITLTQFKHERELASNKTKAIFCNIMFFLSSKNRLVYIYLFFFLIRIYKIINILKITFKIK